MNARTSSFRVAPQAVEVEKHILGGLFLDSHAFDEVSPIISASDFYLEKHDLIFLSMMELSANKSMIGLITVSEQMKKTGRFERAGGDTYLMEICSEVVSSAGIVAHAKIVKEKSIARLVISTATHILEKAYGGEMETRELVDYSEEQIYKIADSTRGGERQGLIAMPEAVLRFAKTLDDRANGVIDRTRLGIPAIDDVMNGLRNGALNVLAARPGFGKSALALQSAVQCGKRVAFFSMEMLIEEEMERLMGQLDPSLNADGVSSQAEVIAKKPLIAQILNKISNYPIHVCEESNITTPYILSECRRLKRKYGELGLITTDYLQLINAIGNHKRRDLEVGQVSSGLKHIGTELRAPVLAVASLSRKPEERDNKRPIESDLRDAGQIESDAHGIIFLYRHAKYNAAAKADKKISNIVEVIIPKNRGGKTGRTLLEFNGARSWFYGLIESDQKYYSNFLKGLEFHGEEKSAKEKGGGKSKGKKAETEPSANWGDKGDPSLIPQGDD